MIYLETPKKFRGFVQQALVQRRNAVEAARTEHIQYLQARQAATQASAFEQLARRAQFAAQRQRQDLGPAVGGRVGKARVEGHERVLFRAAIAAFSNEDERAGQNRQPER